MDDELIPTLVVKSGSAPMEGWVEGCQAYIAIATQVFAEHNPLPSGYTVEISADIKILPPEDADD